MSLILDALRKSEHQRQRQLGPGLAVVAEGRAAHRPPAWLLVLGGLLVLNVVVVIALVMTGRDTRTAAIAPVGAPAPAAVAPATPRAQPLQTAPVTLPARPPPRSEVRPLAAEAATTPAAAPRVPATAPETAPQQPAPAASGVRTAEEARLPRFADMVIRGELNVPHMHLDIHVYSGDPAERFVFINMRRYNEGQATQEGPRVETITHNGVVMDYQGRRFLLARD